MHAAYLATGIAVAVLTSAIALWLADRAPAWGDRRVLHGFALLAPLVCAALLGAGVVKMLLIDCTRFSPGDEILSVLLVGAILGAVASSLLVHARRYRRSARLRGELSRFQAAQADPRAVWALERALGRTKLKTLPKLQMIPAERPIAFVSGVFVPILTVSTGLLAILDDAELEATFAHELFHLKNGDNVFSAGLGWLKDALSFIPVARSAWERYETDRECTADAFAALATGSHEVLAEALVKVGEASLVDSAVKRRQAAGFPEIATGLQARVDGLLDSKKATATRALTSMAAGAMLVLLLAAGALSAPLFSERICMRVFCSLGSPDGAPLPGRIAHGP